MLGVISRSEEIERLYGELSRQNDFMFWMIGIMIGVITVLVGLFAYLQFKMSDRQVNELRKEFKVDQISSSLKIFRHYLMVSSGAPLIAVDELSETQAITHLTEFWSAILDMRIHHELNEDRVNDVVAIVSSLLEKLKSNQVSTRTVKTIDKILTFIDDLPSSDLKKVPENKQQCLRNSRDRYIKLKHDKNL